MMEVFINGCRITLTEGQEKRINKEKERLQRGITSFCKVLKTFGFKEIVDQKGSFIRDKWYAEIIDYSGWSTVWAVGKGLKDSHLFPGGWQYNSPKELSDELTKAIGNL